jgi:hypothetical protein
LVLLPALASACLPTSVPAAAFLRNRRCAEWKAPGIHDIIMEIDDIPFI